MQGWNIFEHSVRLVFSNLAQALRISGLFYVGQIVLALALGVSVYQGDAALESSVQSGGTPWFWLALVVFYTIVTNLWIAVAWHRFILTSEESGLVPAFHGDRMLAYFGKGILIGLVLILPAALAGVIAGMVAVSVSGERAAGLIGTAIFLVALFPVWVAGLRLSTILPGVALKPGLTLGMGWQATKGHSASIMVLALSVLAAALVLDGAGIIIQSLGSAVSLVWSVIAGWVSTMVGVSILTTLYGHYIENRPLR